MMTSIFSDQKEVQENEDPLSEESEREILEMVERQLDRPSPPDTEVLYRRAMHFIDRDVRHLTLQQFNAKFPLQVKRRRARERAGGRSAPSGRGRRASATGSRAGTRSDRGEVAATGPGASSDGEQLAEEGERAARAQSSEDGVQKQELRKRLRSAMIDYSKLVAGAESRGELVEAVHRVTEYVDRVVEG